MTNLSDQKHPIHSLLIEACKKNDRRAQNKVYDLYSKNMYNVSLRMVQNAGIAEDLMQEAFVSAFMHISSYSNEVSFGVWLKRIVINKCIDFLRKRKTELIELNENIYIIEEETQNEDYLKHKADTIIKAIQQLPDGYRIILTLYLLEGYDHEEIADILNISASTSRSQYTRGKRKLLEILNTL